MWQCKVHNLNTCKELVSLILLSTSRQCRLEIGHDAVCPILPSLPDHPLISFDSSWIIQFI